MKAGEMAGSCVDCLVAAPEGDRWNSVGVGKKDNKNSGSQVIP